MIAVSFFQLVSISFAIFSMFFGAGNLIYPIAVGLSAGQHLATGIGAFSITAVLLPFLGLIAMVLFHGDYEKFFARLGKQSGKIAIFICMIIIGPLIAIPRIVTLSHVMIAPFLPDAFSQISPLSSLIFALIFLSVTFLATFRESKIVSLLGNVISPLLLLSLAIIIIRGLCVKGSISTVQTPQLAVFFENLVRGYETLDLLGGIFFSSIVINVLRSSIPQMHKRTTLLKTSFIAGAIGVGLLALVYIGMAILGAYHGTHVISENSGELFRIISFSLLGAQGALVISIAVLMACLSTAIALAAVVGEYVRNRICNKRINFITALIVTLVASLPLSVFGLSAVLTLTGGPVTYIGYPVLIVLTVCNIAHELWGFSLVTLPVYFTLVAAIGSYYQLFSCMC